MARTGRPRKDGDRYPSGDLKPQITVNQIRRGIAAAKALGKDEWLGSEVGRLGTYPCDTGAPLLTPEQTTAGVRYANLAYDYAKEYGLPRASAATGSFEVVSRGEVAGEPTERTRAIIIAYRRASDVLRSAGCLDVVESVCVYDNAVPYESRKHLILGLSLLVRHFVIERASRVDKRHKI